MQQLSIGDGFRFGCGFLLAAAIAGLAMAISGGRLAAVFGAALGGIFDQLGDLSLVPQGLGLI